jgi:RNA polymerase sporulation-specific sigma factor
MPYLFPKPLTAEEEQECFERMEQGDRSAKNMLTAHNLRLVAHIAGKYRSSGEEVEELVSIGTFGLMKAVETFDYRKGARFSTYAARCVENEILMHFRNNRKSSQDVSLNDTIDTDKDGNPLTLMDIIASDMDVAEDVDTKIHLAVMNDYINETLSPREKEIIINRYGIGGVKVQTQRELAKKLNISRSYISRIEKKALGKLKKRYEKG